MEAVQVALRIRPLSQDEMNKGCDECIEVVPGEPQVQIKDLAYTFNYVFPPHIGQKEFYDTAVKGLITKLFEGYNSTILAYGQTGSGKTYTMGTNCAGSDGDSNQLGVIPQAVADIFDFILANEKDFIFKVKVSFMELYQEQCFDLLSDKERGHSVLEIREDACKGVVLPGITELPVSSITETMAALFRGSTGRVTGATAMNQTSSRSHAIFTLTIAKESRTDKNLATASKFHLVDLAGSERIKKTKASGERLKEGVKINQGLLALGNVISALGEGASGAYICYRDSKLTRLLQDSLGGNSLTLMVACVSPADYNLDETVSTMRYADRARKIKNKPIINQDAKAAEIIRLNKIINELRLQLLENKSSAVSESIYELLHKNDQAKIAELQNKIKLLTEHLNNVMLENANLNEKALLSETAKDKIGRKLAQLIEHCNDSLHTLNVTHEITESEQNNITYTVEQIQGLKNNLEEIQTENLKSDQALIDHEIVVSLKHKSCDDDDDIDVGYDEDQVTLEDEKRTLGQVALNKELQELNHAMAIRVTVVQAMEARNKEILDSQHNLKENEDKISQLEKEKDHLLQQLKLSKTKDPSHAEYRAKVAQLESEIGELKKRCQQQANTIKQREKNEDKIATLTAELQSMKIAKVKIVKRMREEQEKYRKWKAETDRALLRIKNEDRKRATAMAKKESLQEKKHIVLKRKMEETLAVNKRLKEALAVAKQMNTRRYGKESTKVNVVHQYLEKELELYFSVLEAEKSLEELMGYRALLNNKIQNLLRAANTEENKKQIAAYLEDLAMRKAQICDLQRKLLVVDQECKGRAKWEFVQSMPDAKVALKCLFDYIIATKKEMQEQSNNFKTEYGKIKEDFDNLRVETANVKLECEKEKADMKKTSDEKMAALMALQRGLPVVQEVKGDACKRLQDVIQDQQEKLNQTEKENARLVQELQNLEAVLMRQKQTTDAGPSDIVDPLEQNAMSRRHRTFDRSIEMVDLVDSSPENNRVPAKRSSENSSPCHCRVYCVSGKCTCINMDRGCGDACLCSAGGCKNREEACSNSGTANKDRSVETVDLVDSSPETSPEPVKRPSRNYSSRCICRGCCASKMCACVTKERGCSDDCLCSVRRCMNRPVACNSDDKENAPDQKSKNFMQRLFDDDITPVKTKKKKRYFFHSDDEDNV